MSGDQRVPSQDISAQFINRMSPMAFDGRAVCESDLMKLFEAARWAPSCFNSQPWRFVYGLKNTDEWAPLFSLLMDINQKWASNCGALVAVLSKTVFEQSGQPAPTNSFDTGAAWMSFALQAREIGLETHAMWGVTHDRVKETLDLPDDTDLRAIIAVGYPGDPSSLPDNLRERETPSMRKELSEIVFKGKYSKGM